MGRLFGANGRDLAAQPLQLTPQDIAQTYTSRLTCKCGYQSWRSEAVFLYNPLVGPSQIIPGPVKIICSGCNSDLSETLKTLEGGREHAKTQEATPATDNHPQGQATLPGLEGKV